jgi:hypothetical protein
MLISALFDPALGKFKAALDAKLFPNFLCKSHNGIRLKTCQLYQLIVLKSRDEKFMSILSIEYSSKSGKYFLGSISPNCRVSDCPIMPFR